MHDSHEVAWPPAFEKKVEVFYHRTLGWQLHVADIVSNGGKPLSDQNDAPEFSPVPHSGFAVLQICLSYFETVAQYSSNPAGKNSGQLFKEGVCSVFPNLAKGNEADVKELLKILWQEGRNGLYHVSMTRVKVGLGQPGNNIAMAFSPSQKQLVIDPHLLPKALKNHLKKYCDALLDSRNVVLRRDFEAMFDKENGIRN